MSSRLWSLSIAAGLGLAGCSTAHTHIGDEDPGMGEAVKYDTALQTMGGVDILVNNAAFQNMLSDISELDE